MSLWSNVFLSFLVVITTTSLFVMDGCHKHPPEDCSPTTIQQHDGGWGPGVFCCQWVGRFQECEQMACPLPVRTER